MRKNLIFSLILAVCVVVLSFACVKTEASPKVETQPNNTEIITISKNNTTDKALETRFLNMLNHSFVYNEAFYDDTALVSNSVLGVLDMAEGSFVEETILSDYIFNMYGKIYDDFGFLGENEKEGYVYIIPRGYNIYTHKVVSITNNNDGSYTVVTDVEISYEDGSVQTFACETVFLENSESAFGYNIIYSDILEDTFTGVDC